MEVVIPIQTISFYNNGWSDPRGERQVVIPIQTISFYNTWIGGVNEEGVGCHTYPNDKLLQLDDGWTDAKLDPVVIPIQTISFYNATDASSNPISAGCHTYPNDKLLQRY